jgi:hypothetical protein
MFSRENSELQMIETAHVNKRKQVFTNQYPVGDDVSTLQPLRSSAGFERAGYAGFANWTDMDRLSREAQSCLS